jgi:hypothetical protein
MNTVQSLILVATVALLFLVGKYAAKFTVLASNLWG